jgi:hypothetical protein
LSHLSFSGKLSPPLDPSYFPDHTLAPSRLPPRPYKGLNSILSHYTSLSLLLWIAIPSAIGPVPDSIPSHSHTIPLSLLLWTVHPPAIGPIPSPLSLIPDWSTQSTGLLYNRDPFTLGSLIALMTEAPCTSETSVDNYFTRQYIPEDKSELHTRRHENLKSHKAYYKFGNKCRTHGSLWNTKQM